MAETPDIDMPEPDHRATAAPMNQAQKLTVAAVLLGMIVTIVGVMWTVFGSQRDISDNTKAIAQVAQQMATANEAQNRRMDKLEDYISKIDREGTQYGKGSFNARNTEQEQSVKRIEKLEDSLNKLVPTVTQMSTNLEWISGWVKVQAQQPADRPTHK